MEFASLSQMEVDKMAAKGRGAGVLALVALVGGLTYLVSGGDAPIASQVGYFKSEEQHRVRSYYSEHPLSEQQARGIFDGEAHTEGRLSRSVYYSGAAEAPGDALTLAGGLRAALAVTTNPPFDDWDWMVHRNPAGLVSVTER